ncbi:MAG: hypothetical protein ACO1RA_16545 [Planctomycetaceae bacterium]
MKKILAAGLVALMMFAGVLSAAPPKKAKNGPVENAAKALEASGITLSDEQKTKVQAVYDEFQGKFKEAQSKVDGALTGEQKKARAEATKSAKEAGKKGKELQAAALEAMKLTDDQKKGLDEAQKHLNEVRANFEKSLKDILTDEQKGKVKLGGGKKGK